MSGPAYAQTIPSNRNDLQAPRLDWANGQVVAVGASSAASTAFNATFNTLVELSATTNCWYTVALSPTAAAHTAGNQYLTAGAVRYVYVPAGWLIAVIEDTAGGYIGMLPVLLPS